MPYATGEDLVKRYDHDLVGDSASDDRQTLPRAQVVEHPNVIAALAGASGRVNAALLNGGKYEPEQLAELTGDDKEYLIDLVCDLAMVRLAGRRGENKMGKASEQIRESAEALLELLRDGKNLFNLPEAIDASITDTDGPTAIDLENRNDLTTRMGRYFPQPASRLPRAQGGE